MPPQKNPNLWALLDAEPGLEAVAHAWRTTAGTHFDTLVRIGILSLTGKSADEHPCKNRVPCPCYHRADRGSRPALARCTCDPADCAPFQVKADELRLYRLKLSRLAEMVAGAFGLKGRPRAEAGLVHTYDIGAWYPEPGVAYSAHCCLATDDDNVAHAAATIAAQAKKPFAFFIPHRGLISADTQNTVTGAGGLVLALDATTNFDAAGSLALLPKLYDPLRPMHRTATVPATDNDLIRVVELAEKLSERRPKNGPTALQFLAAYARGMTHEKIARKYRCSRSQVTSLKGQIEKQLGVDLQKLVQRSGDLADTVKKVEDRRAKKIHQKSAVTGREEEDE